mgnify:CR=1 FL=1
MIFKINYVVLNENKSYFGFFQNLLFILKKKQKIKFFSKKIF